MNRKLAARCLAELGNLTRLGIYRLLVRAGPPGLNISEIQLRLDIPASTLAFHLRGLVGAGLVSQERIGRSVICRRTSCHRRSHPAAAASTVSILPRTNP
ncbi:helix-turn-helix transcriptional regulator [Bradyrhizobium sp. WSM1253]|uniref:ArsR/SmtB family transcription factor n=1 Tax=Bradyrhizobium sp. WSM1253 TaxID=319003 RepID=UPI00025D3049|nr:helix-turn-helix domain-containing protein [Bradyrhizobium sp. WSM1253]EIG62813.1 putative transcriptional regulator [Bradyrhizobium sp. WSM1253]